MRKRDMFGVEYSKWVCSICSDEATLSEHVVAPYWPCPKCQGKTTRDWDGHWMLVDEGCDEVVLTRELPDDC